MYVRAEHDYLAITKGVHSEDNLAPPLWRRASPLPIIRIVSFVP